MRVAVPVCPVTMMPFRAPQEKAPEASNLGDVWTILAGLKGEGTRGTVLVGLAAVARIWGCSRVEEEQRISGGDAINSH